MSDCIAARPADEYPLAPRDWEQAAGHLGHDMPGICRRTSIRACSSCRRTAAGAVQRLARYCRATDAAPSRRCRPLRACGTGTEFRAAPLRAACAELAPRARFSPRPAPAGELSARCGGAALLRYRELTADGRLRASGHAAPDRVVARVNDLLTALDAGAGATTCSGTCRAPAALRRAQAQEHRSFLAFSEGGPMPLYPLEYSWR